MIHDPGPCVLFATPGMISGGFSLEVFKHWAPSEKNLVTLPGYCMAGTVGHKLLTGKTTKVDIDQATKIDVRCQILQLKFSLHTDSKGIMDLVKFLSPKHVILVHGEKPKMATLKEKIHTELQIPCYYPPNNGKVQIPSTHLVKANASPAFVRSCLSPDFIFKRCCSNDAESTLTLEVQDVRVAEGVLVMEKSMKPMVIHQDELLHGLGEEKHETRFAYCFPVYICDSWKADADPTFEQNHNNLEDQCFLQALHSKLISIFPGLNIQDNEDFILLCSLRMRVCTKANCPYRADDNYDDQLKVAFCCCDWSQADDKFAQKMISEMKNMMHHPTVK